MSRGEEVSARFAGLAGELGRAMRGWEERAEPWEESRFRELALRAFRLQFEGNRPYRRYCRGRGRTPETVEEWTEVPPAPTAAFREVPLVVGGPEEAEVEFRTSGTTRGARDRGRHLVRDPRLYRRSVGAGFRRLVLDPLDVSAPLPVCSLVPPFSGPAGSSLAWMFDAVADRFGAPGSLGAAAPAGEAEPAVDWGAARRFVERACDRGRPACVLATTLAAAEWTDRLAEEGRSYRLPPGSFLVDTGGSKGREGLGRPEVVAAVEERLGVPPERVVNEFGMTELLSQRYGGTGEDGRAGWLRGPPWLRTRALDPVDLEPLPDGETGLLCHFDLANAGSVCAVLTEDLGRVRSGAVRYAGRTPGAEPRGCSLATAELLRGGSGGR